MSTLHLQRLFDPRSIVLIGASARPQSPGLALARNLLQGNYRGDVHLVNPRYDEVLGTPCLASLDSVGGTPDIALVLAPTRLLKRILKQCSKKGVKLVIIMSSASNSAALHRRARRLGLRLLGPHSAGLIRPPIGLNASYSNSQVDAGSLAVISQSASLAAALIDWAEVRQVGFSALLSTGAETDVSLADLLDLLAEDPQTRAIVVYLDRVRSSRSFLSALSATARIKPVILMKSTLDGARYCDVLPRTGQIRSSDAVFHAALARTGVVRIQTFSNLFACVRILASNLRIRGQRLGVISNGSAPAMLACERLERSGFIQPTISATLKDALGSSLGDDYRGHNPVILRGGGPLERQYRLAIDTFDAHREFDAFLVIFTPDARHDPDEVADAVIAAHPTGKPLLTCWLGESSVGASRQRLADAGIATFDTPEAAADGFDFLYRYHASQQQLLQLPQSRAPDASTDLPAAQALIDEVLAEGQRVVDPERARALLDHFDIGILPARHCRDEKSAIEAAEAIGYPLALKLVSPELAYKASVVRTRLDVVDAIGVRDGFSTMRAELTRLRPDATFDGVLIERMHSASNRRLLHVGLHRDPSFGPVLSIGIGDELAPLYARPLVQLPPLNTFLIERLLDMAPLCHYLGPLRHQPAIATEPLMQALHRLSEMACELPEIFSLDINPLILDDSGTTAVDVHLVLEAPASLAPHAHLAIHPYPRDWVRNTTLRNGLKATLRPIRPEDGEAIQQLVREMSRESRYFRFMHAINELSPQLVAQFTKLDYDRQMAFVAVLEAPSPSDPENDDAADTEGLHHEEAIIGVSRYVMDRDAKTGEFAVSVADQWQRQGLARHLMDVLVEHARHRGLERMQGDVLKENTGMHGLMAALGFSRHEVMDEPEIERFQLDLDESRASGDRERQSHRRAGVL